MKDLSFVHKGKGRRGGKRYTVRWNAILDVRFPDFHDQIDVTVVNFSSGGALLHSKRLTVRNQHLVITDTRPELKLKISLPDRVLELTTEIVWYNVSSESGMYEIGLDLKNYKQEANISVEGLVKILKSDR